MKILKDLIGFLIIFVILSVFTTFGTDFLANPILTIILFGKYPEQIVLKIFGTAGTRVGVMVFWVTEICLAFVAYLLISKLIKYVRKQWKSNNSSKSKRW